MTGHTSRTRFPPAPDLPLNLGPTVRSYLHALIILLPAGPVNFVR